jgi:hypothetical protein
MYEDAKMGEAVLFLSSLGVFSFRLFLARKGLRLGLLELS